jgi:hypothetical protein
LGLAKALLWPLSGPELLRETKNRSWQRRPKATGLLLARRDALGEINVKVLRSPLTANQSELNIRPMSFSEALYARETFSLGSHARRSLFPRASRPPRVDQTQNPFSRKLGYGFESHHRHARKFDFTRAKEDSRSNQLRRLDVATTVYPLTNF